MGWVDWALCTGFGGLCVVGVCGVGVRGVGFMVWCVLGWCRVLLQQFQVLRPFLSPSLSILVNWVQDKCEGCAQAIHVARCCVCLIISLHILQLKRMFACGSQKLQAKVSGTRFLITFLVSPQHFWWKGSFFKVLDTGYTG